MNVNLDIKRADCAVLCSVRREPDCFALDFYPTHDPNNMQLTGTAAVQIHTYR